MSDSKLAFVFPGQGSQSKGMLEELAQQFSVIGDTFQQAQSVVGYDLWALCQNDEEGRINLTAVTQPLLLTASVAIWRLWQELTDVKPAIMAGHSLGEWSGLVCAGVVQFEDALKLVQARGQFMQEAVPVGVGSMAAVMGLDDDQIRACCQAASQGEVVEPVNYNAPGQVVIAGHKAAVSRAGEACKAAGAKRALPLPVSAPFHSELMKPAAEKLSEMINSTQFAAPEIPLVHNVNARLESNPEAIKQLMIQQIFQPVLWVDCVQALGADCVVECGPGKVLTGLIKRIDRSIKGFSTDSVDSIGAAVSEIAGAK